MGFNDATEFADGHFDAPALSGTLLIGSTGVKLSWGVIVATNAGNIVFRRPSGGSTYFSLILTAGQVIPLSGMGFDAGLEINTSVAMSVAVHTVVP